MSCHDRLRDEGFVYKERIKRNNYIIQSATEAINFQYLQTIILTFQLNQNALADEYLRLIYYGLRAKDNSFNAKMNTDFDNAIGIINIIQQDIGRVLLNLYNNAFYAVCEKKRQQPEAYEPKITVTTKKLADKIEVKVKDNGNGIPQKVVDEIFQPFYTTNPTGQGTGLGLSLSYDIVKAHGGKIKIETKEGERTELIIELPVK
jgi:two-component system NtrC family sensor kinase